MPEVEEIEYTVSNIVHTDGGYCADTCPHYPTNHPMLMNRCGLFGLLQKAMWENMKEKYLRHRVCNCTKSNCKIKIMTKEEIADKVEYKYEDNPIEYLLKLKAVFKTDHEYEIAKEIYFDRQRKYYKEEKGMDI